MFIDISKYLVPDKSKDWQTKNRIISIRYVHNISVIRVVAPKKSKRATMKYYLDMTNRLHIEITKAGYMFLEKLLTTQGEQQ